MKYSEFKKAVEGLSKHYSVYRDCGSVDVDYKSHTVLKVPAHQFMVLRMETYKNGYIDRFRESLPYSHRLWMLASEFSMTPVSERREHRWNVIVGRNKFGENSGPVAYFKRDDPLDIELSYAGSVEVLSNEWYVFSDNEFSNLVACLKRQPDGDRLVKIAELGKVPAPEVDE